MNAISRALAGKEQDGTGEETGVGGEGGEDVDEMGMGMGMEVKMTQAELEAEMEELRRQVPRLDDLKSREDL